MHHGWWSHGILKLNNFEKVKGESYLDDDLHVLWVMVISVYPSLWTDRLSDTHNWKRYLPSRAVKIKSQIIVFHWTEIDLIIFIMYFNPLIPSIRNCLNMVEKLKYIYISSFAGTMQLAEESVYVRPPSWCFCNQAEKYWRIDHSWKGQQKTKTSLFWTRRKAKVHTNCGTIDRSRNKRTDIELYSWKL